MLYRLRQRVKSELQVRGIPSSINDYRLQKLENKHTGEKCVIVAMGPSLKTSDLDLLHNIPTFACNKIYLAYEETKWRPTYYTVIDVLVAENNKKAIESVSTTRIFPSAIESKLARKTGDIFYKYNGSFGNSAPNQTSFSEQLNEGILAGGYSVVLDQVQLAYAMGFQTVFIIGLDFSFKTAPTTGDNCAHGEILKSQGEVNHFHPDYRKKGETWTIPRLDKQELAFHAAKAAFEKDGRKLLNASRQTALDVLERTNFETIFD